MGKISEFFLKMMEKKLKKFLIKNVKVMPISFKKIIMSYYPNAIVRKKYFESLGGNIGENSFFNIGFIVSPNNDLSYLHIGNNVSVGPNVTCICESNANNGDEINSYEYVKKNLTKKEKIIINDEVWIGTNVTILPGITIGKCTIIGAGSVVTEDLAPYGVYVGSPAKKVRDVRTGEKSNVK